MLRNTAKWRWSNTVIALAKVVNKNLAIAGSDGIRGLHNIPDTKMTAQSWNKLQANSRSYLEWLLCLTSGRLPRSINANIKRPISEPTWTHTRTKALSPGWIHFARKTGHVCGLPVEKTARSAMRPQCKPTANIANLQKKQVPSKVWFQVPTKSCAQRFP